MAVARLVLDAGVVVNAIAIDLGLAFETFDLRVDLVDAGVDRIDLGRNVIGPFVAGVGGQSKVTVILGLVTTSHVMEVVAVVAAEVQISWPVAFKPVVTEQALAGTV